jgi:acetyl esterase/lipase
MPHDKLPELRAMWPDWWLAPVRAPDWKGLCDTFIRTAECDPLRDEGEAYGMRLVAGGNKVTIKRYLGCPHTFMYLHCMKQKGVYDQDAVEALRVAHGSQA